MKAWMERWTSRAFWLAIVPLAIGMLKVLGVVGEEVDETSWAESAALIAPSVLFIIFNLWGKTKLP